MHPFTAQQPCVGGKVFRVLSTTYGYIPRARSYEESLALRDTFPVDEHELQATVEPK